MVLRGRLSAPLLSRKLLGIIAGMAVAAAPLFVAPDEAAARRFNSRSSAVKSSPAKRAPAIAEAVKGPLTLVVSLRRQRISVWGPDGKITEAPVSTGTRGHETPTGVFSVIGKEVMHYSNLYGDAPMPFMNRITWSGVALHAGALPGYPASHGCIRLPYGFARSLYGMTRMGTRVIVAHGDVAPQSIVHTNLFKPLPSESSASLVTAATVATSMATASDAAGVISALIGITPAAAAERPAGERPRRTREIVAAERAIETNRIVARIKELDELKTAHEPKVRAATQAAIEARLAQRNVQIEADSLERRTKKLEGEVETASRELAKLGRKGERLRNETAIDRAAELEDAIEQKLTAASMALENVRAERAAIESRANEAREAVERAENARVVAFDELRTTLDGLREAQAAKTAADKAAANRAKPITVLISRKTGKLHVRQGFDDVIETPVTIAEPERPFGTHVYTALAFTEGEKALRWNAITAAEDAPLKARDERPRRKHKSEEKAEAPIPKASDASEALGRVTIPQEAMERIAELIKPGSTLMISDYGISHETGKYTDYILLTR